MQQRDIPSGNFKCSAFIWLMSAIVMYKSFSETDLYFWDLFETTCKEGTVHNCFEAQFSGYPCNGVLTCCNTAHIEPENIVIGVGNVHRTNWDFIPWYATIEICVGHGTAAQIFAKWWTHQVLKVSRNAKLWSFLKICVRASWNALQ